MFESLRRLFTRSADNDHAWVSDANLKALLDNCSKDEANDLFVADLMDLYKHIESYNQTVNTMHQIDIVLPQETDWMLRAEQTLMGHDHLVMGLRSGKVMGKGGGILKAVFVTEPNAAVSFLHVISDDLFRSRKSFELSTNADFGAFAKGFFHHVRREAIERALSERAPSAA